MGYEDRFTKAACSAHWAKKPARGDAPLLGLPSFGMTFRNTHLRCHTHTRAPAAAAPSQTRLVR